MKERIVWDNDDTLADTTPAVAQHILTLHPDEYTYTELTSRARVTPQEDPRLHQLRQDFFNDGRALINIRVLPGVKMGLSLIAKIINTKGESRFEQYLSSGRSSDTLIYTIAWLDLNHLAQYINPLNAYHSASEDQIDSKLDRAYELGADAVVEDDSDQIQRFTKNGFFTFIITQRWNRHLPEGPFAKRVSSALEIAYYLKRYQTLENFKDLHRQTLKDTVQPLALSISPT